MGPLVSIGDFARMTFVSVKALRHYHEVGLLPPAEIDPDTGYRRYELTQVPTAQVIRRLRELGMSLDDVRAVIEAPDVRARNAAIGAHLRRMEGKLEQTRATVKSLRLLLDEKSPPAIAVDYRAIGPSEAIAIRGEIVAVVPVEPAAEPAGRIELLSLPRVEYAIAVHSGPVEDIDRTYAALGAVVAERAIGVQGPIREEYVVGAFETPDEQRHRTEIGWPVFQTAT